MKITILGAGSWGLTLAWLFSGESGEDKEIWLWDYKPEKIQKFQLNRQIDFPVPVKLSGSIRLTSSLNEAIAEAHVVVFVVTTAGTRSVLRQVMETGALSPHAILVNASKGIESKGMVPLSQVFEEEASGNPFAVISGPTLAKEILKGLPTAVAVASHQVEVSEFLQKHLSRENIFRLYSNNDLLGVELGGALKNIFAIASGFMQARQLGENARSALITRGLVEMSRLSVALGAEEQTLYGLSGLGDLLATCNSPLSRNYQVGYQLASGKPISDILKELKVVAEGVTTTCVVSRLSDKLGVEAPIVKMVEYCLSDTLVDDALLIKSLMSRKMKSESLF